MNNRKLDIFKTLGQLNKKDRDVFNNLTEEEAKELFPLVVMRWMSGTDDEFQIMMLNEMANPYMFSLHKHKELLTKLLIACSSGHTQRYVWLKASPKKLSGISTIVSVVGEYFSYNDKDALLALPLLSDHDILSFAEQLGKQPDELTKLKKELKLRSHD